MTSHSNRKRRSTQFAGFQLESDAPIPIPAEFFTDALPQISAIEELQVLLTVLRLLDGKLSQPLAEDVIADDRDLRFALRIEGNPNQPDDRIAHGLELGLARGTLLRFITIIGQTEHRWYYVNSSENRRAIRDMQAGTLAPPATSTRSRREPKVVADLPNAFRLYEQNIGALTPLIADQIRLAIEEYPDEWIEEAIGEAVAYNRRSWRYIVRILENWSAQGKGNPAT